VYYIYIYPYIYIYGVNPYLSAPQVHEVRIGLLHKEGDMELYYGSDATNFSPEALAKFADAYLAGELTPNKKTDVSAPAPGAGAGEDEDENASVDESAVVILTAANFDEVVRDASKDVLVMIYR